MSSAGNCNASTGLSRKCCGLPRRNTRRSSPCVSMICSIIRLRLLQHQISAKLISLQRHYKADPDIVRGDDAQLQQAFMNLLLNALEAMGPNGVLTVSTGISEGEGGARLLKVHIEDTGVGIARENLERSFEPFFTTKKNGTGLGLAISRLIAHEHRGTIQVQSEINKGSKFTLSLPVSAAS